MPAKGCSWQQGHLGQAFSRWLRGAREVGHYPCLSSRPSLPQTHVEAKDTATLLRAQRHTLGDRDLTTVALGPPPPAGAGAAHLQVLNHDDVSAATTGEEHRAQLLGGRDQGA